MTDEESNGKAYVVGQWEAGTRVYRLRKEARSGMTKKSNGEGLHCGTMGSWDSVYRSGTDSVVRGTLDKLPTDGLWNAKVYVLYVYSTEPVLSAELC